MDMLIAQDTRMDGLNRPAYDNGNGGDRWFGTEPMCGYREKVPNWSTDNDTAVYLWAECSTTATSTRRNSEVMRGRYTCRHLT